MYVSGQLGLDPKVSLVFCITLSSSPIKTSDFPARDVRVQTDQALKNLGVYESLSECVIPLTFLCRILRAGGSDYKKVLKTTILLRDMSDFTQVNTVYAKCMVKTIGKIGRSSTLSLPDFPTDPPARATYAVSGLPKGMMHVKWLQQHTHAFIQDALVEIEAIAHADGPLDTDAE